MAKRINRICTASYHRIDLLNVTVPFIICTMFAYIIISVALNGGWYYKPDFLIWVERCIWSLQSSEYRSSKLPSLTHCYPHLSSLLGPTHTRPPCLGEGLLQERWRNSKPVPQVVLHCPHDDQGVQPPFLSQQKHGKTLTYFTVF